MVGRMKSSWTPSRDKRLLALQGAGRTAAEIAKSLGTSRNAVIGRSRRLRGIVYRSDIESWARANARRSQEAKKRMKARRKSQREALRELSRAVRRGVPPGKAWRAPIAPAPCGDKSGTASEFPSRRRTKKPSFGRNGIAFERGRHMIASSLLRRSVTSMQPG